MKTHPFEEWVEPYVTGDLPERRRERMEAHLASCARCRGAVARLESIRTEAGRLPRSIDPGEDLWPGIAAELEPRGEGSDEARARERPAGAGQTRLAAAAVALLGLAGTLWWAGQRGRNGDVAADPEAIEEVRLEGTLAAFGPAESAYREAASVLEESYEAGVARLEPRTAAALDRNLRILDAAIGEAREAVAARPDDPDAVEILAGRYRDKVEALRRLARISAPEPDAPGGPLR